MSTKPHCPLCAAAMEWDPVDGRFECGGVVQHCYVVEGNGEDRRLVLVASGSGEDAELFTSWPWPGAGGLP